MKLPTDDGHTTLHDEAHSSFLTTHNTTRNRMVGNNEENEIKNIDSNSDTESEFLDADFLGFGPSQKDQEETPKEASEEEEEKEKKNSKKDSLNRKKKSNNSLRASRNFIPCVSEHTQDLPPWMKQPHDHTRYTPPLVCLHNEIVNFYTLMKPRDEERKIREDLVEKIKKVVYGVFGEEAEMVVFGSQATGLYLPSSDIDIMVNLQQNKKKSKDNSDRSSGSTGSDSDSEIEDLFNNDETDSKNKNDEKVEERKESVKEKEQREMNEYQAPGIDADGKSFFDPTTSPLFYLANALYDEFQKDLTYIEIVENTRIPLVKFTYQDISVDVSFDQEGCEESVRIMNQFLRDFPTLKPLAFVLKYFLAIRGLNQPYTGGMGSFMLQMMVVSYLQHRCREELLLDSSQKFTNDHSIMNLGVCLIEFLELYGIDFNYLTTGISLRNNGSYFPKGSAQKRDIFYNATRTFSLAIENPIDIASDVGRSTFRMNNIQRALEVAFKVLLAHVGEPTVPATSILASIIPPSEELKKRALLFSNDQDNCTSDDEKSNKKHKSHKIGGKRKRPTKKERNRKRHHSNY